MKNGILMMEVDDVVHWSYIRRIPLFVQSLRCR
jgi:hypothetical protein